MTGVQTCALPIYLARGGIGVVVRAGAPRPDIGTADALKRAIIDTPSIMFSNGASVGLIHGMVDRSLNFTLDDLRRLPSESRIHFLECQGNSSPGHHGHKKFDFATVQDLHGGTSCAEWTGVPLSILLKECGVQKGGTWLVSESEDAGRYTYTLPMAKAMDDVMVVYGQNGEPLRPDQGYPVRLLVPGWEGPYSVKWLRQIKVVDQPYMAWDEAMAHSIARPDLGEKARWYHFEMPVKSLKIGRAHV